MHIQISPLMRRALDVTIAQLAGDLDGVFSPETVARYVWESEFPKPLTDAVVLAADVVVMLGCGGACPVYPGKRYQDWRVADPAGQPLEVVRRIRYELYHHVCELIETLTRLHRQ